MATAMTGKHYQTNRSQIWTIGLICVLVSLTIDLSFAAYLEALKPADFPPRSMMLPETNKTSFGVEAHSYRWTKNPGFSNFPADAVFAGVEGLISRIYVGRAYHEGNLLPAKIVKQKTVLFVSVSYNGKEYQKEEFELLLGPPVNWIENSECVKVNSSVLGKDSFKLTCNAIPVGKTTLGETLFMGRTHVLNLIEIIPGRVDLNSNRLLVPSGWKEHVIANYEVMVYPGSKTSP